MPFIDSHAHLSGETLFADADGYLDRAKAAGVDTIVNICTDIDSLEKGLSIANKYSWVYNVASTTPHDVEHEGEQFFPIVAQHAKMGNLVAIGETGLDYHYERSPREIQKKYLINYLHLALENNLPIVIHCRDAFNDFFEIIDQEFVINGKHAPGVLHCFTGSMADVEKVIARGWFVSISGIITFKKSEELREVVKNVPLEHFLIETDAPYLAPQNKRGKTNESSFLPEIAMTIAQIKGISPDAVAFSTSQNTKNLFNIN